MRIYKFLFFLFSLFSLTYLLSSCARMGNPDGGWYDEKPPKIVKTEPNDGDTNVQTKKIKIYFNEFVKIDNASENIVICPPQIEQADIKSRGKYISINLKDSLKSNTTYTIDFSDAIKDNNENNPLGNYTYSFSTGNDIDTLQISGTVVSADGDEFVQGILVGIYRVDDDSITSKPFMRIGRTDSKGHFVVKGVKEGKYKIYALKDMDQNYMLTPKSGEMMAFSADTISPSVFTDIRQDTIMKDQLHIKSIDRVHYQHFLPDNIILRAFNEEQNNRNFTKYDRTEPERFVLTFSGGDSILPKLKGLDFSTENAFIIDSDEKKDSITYWLRDTALVNTDTLTVEMKYNMTDTIGNLVEQTDTLVLLPKLSFEKRQKAAKKEYDEWFKKEQKKKKKGQPYDSIMAQKPLDIKFGEIKKFNPEDSVMIELPTPLAKIDTSKIHIYIEGDTLKVEQKFRLEAKPDISIRTYKLTADWQYDTKYILKIDSAAFEDIYGKISKSIKKNISIDKKSTFGILNIEAPYYKDKSIIVQLIDNSEKVLRSKETKTGKVSFPYVLEQEYYVKMIVDRNSNGKWDTGNYFEKLQPEEVYYYPEPIKCKGDWTITKTWITDDSQFVKKPTVLRKTKSTDKKNKQTAGKNAMRAQQLGIELPDYLK